MNILSNSKQGFYQTFLINFNIWGRKMANLGEIIAFFKIFTDLITYLNFIKNLLNICCQIGKSLL